MAALISSKVWFLFIALKVVVVVGSPTTDLLESVDCLFSDCVRYFTNADRNNDRFSYKLASDIQNTTYKLLIMWDMTLRVCLNRSVFLLFSLSRGLAFSPSRTRSRPPSLEALYSFPPFTLYKFHVFCFIFSHFNSLPTASLSLLLHLNCDFHGYPTRSRSTCIKCPSGINLKLVLKPRLSLAKDIPLISPWLSVTASYHHWL